MSIIAADLSDSSGYERFGDGELRKRERGVEIEGADGSTLMPQMRTLVSFLKLGESNDGCRIVSPDHTAPAVIPAGGRVVRVSLGSWS